MGIRKGGCLVGVFSPQHSIPVPISPQSLPSMVRTWPALAVASAEVKSIGQTSWCTLGAKTLDSRRYFYFWNLHGLSAHLCYFLGEKWWACQYSSCQSEDMRSNSELTILPSGWRMFWESGTLFWWLLPWQVLAASDVVLEVLDARDPLGCRCPQVEEAIVRSHQKRLILVLNKSGEQRGCLCLPHALMRYEENIEQSDCHWRLVRSNSDLSKTSACALRLVDNVLGSGVLLYPACCVV